MRKALVLLLMAVLALPASAASGAPTPAPKATVPLFAGGGTLVSGGIFFPGTAVYDASQGYVGPPYQVQRGTDIMFTNLDAGDLVNGHQIRSFKRKRGRPLFQSKRLDQPGQQALVIVSHLKPGIYDYFCPVHYGMYGRIEITQ